MVVDSGINLHYINQLYVHNESASSPDMCAAVCFTQKVALKGIARAQHTAFGRTAGIKLAVARVSAAPPLEPSYGSDN